MLGTVVSIAVWFAFALIMAFAARDYGWLGVLGVMTPIMAWHVWMRGKTGEWLL